MEQVLTDVSGPKKVRMEKGTAIEKKPEKIDIDSAKVLINRELSWLSFARRVLALAEDPDLPLLERVKFAGIMGMLYDEFAMKRIGGIKRKIEKRKRKKKNKLSPDGLTAEEEMQACREELHEQARLVSRLVQAELRPALAAAGIPILEYTELNDQQQVQMQQYFLESVEPILTPLAVDASHPFPFISNLGLNLAVVVTENKKKRNRFVRIKVPANRPRWIALPEGGGFVPLEQVIAANLRLLFPKAAGLECYIFRVTRGAKDDPWERVVSDDDEDTQSVTDQFTGPCSTSWPLRMNRNRPGPSQTHASQPAATRSGVLATSFSLRKIERTALNRSAAAFARSLLTRRRIAFISASVGAQTTMSLRISMISSPHVILLVIMIYARHLSVTNDPFSLNS